ncbi:MAG: pyridoxal-phosphate dependent enzyme [Candidatus Binataceae bacterium]
MWPRVPARREWNGCGLRTDRPRLGDLRNHRGARGAGSYDQDCRRRADAPPAYALSFAARKPVSTDSAKTEADGLAVRVPDADVVEIINRFAERVVSVSDEEIEDAMRHYFTDTHNVAEGAGAATLAALLREQDQMRGRRVGLVLSGGNVDRAKYARILTDPNR